MEENILQYKMACRNYFQNVSLNSLRSYGRFLGLRSPTTQHKEDLIEDIIKMLCGEMQPERNKQGAPVKENVNMDVIQAVEQLKGEYRIGEYSEVKTQEKTNAVIVHLDVDIGALNKQQRKKFNDFIESL